MKIKSGYMMREVGGTYVVVPTGKATLDFSGMMNLNGSGAFLWKELEAGKTEAELLSVFLAKYDVDKTAAEADLAEFLAKLKSADLLE